MSFPPVIVDLNLAITQSGAESLAQALAMADLMAARIEARRTAPKGSHRRELTQEQRDRLRLLIYLYWSGLSSTEVGFALEISKQRVLQLLRLAGVERRRVGAVHRQRLTGRWLCTMPHAIQEAS